MKPFAPCILKRAGLGGRVVVEHGRLVHLTELQAHAFSVFEIDGWKEDQNKSFGSAVMRGVGNRGHEIAYIVADREAGAREVKGGPSQA